ncbi:DNA repair protein REV1 isoform X2 [Coffea arabica]|uniref:DNA repair protein REV1 n=1 Tax=Coffea arabica TaxID=13443 RepID=A0A6P6VU46_COFAR|nr:DNA repair protein REV1-like isoform X2 [Coffea arabica]
MSLNSSSRSATSNSNSKRSVTSNSNSNPSTSGNNSCRNNDKRNRKRKTDQNQKTLGMAWGANSRSSSRSAFRNSPFPDFGSYMVMKNQKLHQQFDAEASSSSVSGACSGKPIFDGVSIFVDGYTVPSSQELKGYMLKYGGRFENYFSRHHVTHIICSNLPDSKIKNLRSFSGGLPVIKPTWVLESVAANKLLSWIPYQLDQLASETKKQPKLSAFGFKSGPVLDDLEESISGQAVPQSGIATLRTSCSLEANIFGKAECTEEVEECHSVSDDPFHPNAAESTDQAPTYCMENHCEVELDAAVVGQSDAGYHSHISPCQDPKSDHNDCLEDHIIEESSSSKTIRPSTTGHSTLSDANFVENYFKFSRLHFIGTWRNRYRKRFLSSANGFKDMNPSRNAFATSQKTTIIHVDMDCFFVSVVIRKHPDLKDKPVAVCHSDNSRGTAEISSANYPARNHGVKAGMFIRDAKALCPQLVILPYNFDAYEEVADQFYDILHKHCNKVQAVSCDEAFIDVTDLRVEDPELFARAIRTEIHETTGCTASAGISGSMLMARVATRIAKPDGLCYIPSEKVDDYLHELPVKALPGIGHVLEEKLKKKQINTCGQLRLISKESLQKDFGVKTGDMLWNFSRGIDNRLVGVFQESKSIGADVNWGVRFNDLNDMKDFLLKLCKEVSLRLQGCGLKGRTITLKIKKRRSDAGEPVKYMGCGDCENLSRSVTLPMATDDVDVFQRITAQLFGYFHIDARDIRGAGLQASKLESADRNIRGHEKYSIRSWLVSSPARKSSMGKDVSEHMNGAGKGDQLYSDIGPPVQAKGSFSGGEAHVVHRATLPALHELDVGVIESLPPEVLSEINDLYAGELISFISKKKEKNAGNNVMDEEQSLSNPLVPPNKDFVHDAAEKIKSSEKEDEQYINKMIQGLPETSGSVTALLPETDSLMPSSLSQVDSSVLQQLPEELLADVLVSLPAHRRPDFMSNDVYLDHIRDQTGAIDFLPSNNLWVGNPPRWVDNFRLSSCQLLNRIAVLYNKSSPRGQFSSVLQLIMSEYPLDDGGDDAVNCLCELMKQYIKLKIETDVEEIYTCSCLLRRLTSRSELFLQVYNCIIPHLQAAVGETYGGDLNICFIE